MELYTKLNMKDLLAQSLYVLMKTQSFDKITIKQISSKAGVIRGTFYNHFYDKYEALEYLVSSILIQKNQQEVDKDGYSDLLIDILKNVEDNKDFFGKCIEVEGQNGFDMMLENIFVLLFNDSIKKNKVDVEKLGIDIELLTNAYSKVFVYVIKSWVMNNCNKKYLEVYKSLEIIFSNSIKDLMFQGKV